MCDKQRHEFRCSHKETPPSLLRRPCRHEARISLYFLSHSLHLMNILSNSHILQEKKFTEVMFVNLSSSLKLRRKLNMISVLRWRFVNLYVPLKQSASHWRKTHTNTSEKQSYCGGDKIQMCNSRTHRYPLPLSPTILLCHV